MLQLPNVNEERHTASHHRIALIRVIALSSVVRQHDPISMPAYLGNELWVGNVGWEVRAMALYAIACTFKGVGNVLPQVAVGEESKLMLRIRKLVLPLARLVGARSPP